MLLLKNESLGPLAGDVKVIFAPLTGLPWLSSANAERGLRKCVSIREVCWSPSFISIVTAVPGARYSYAPMSHTGFESLFPSTGLARPRWSVARQVVGFP